jgi:hypothetical protein
VFRPVGEVRLTAPTTAPGKMKGGKRARVLYYLARALKLEHVVVAVSDGGQMSVQAYCAPEVRVQLAEYLVHDTNRETRRRIGRGR